MRTTSIVCVLRTMCAHYVQCVSNMYSMSVQCTMYAYNVHCTGCEYCVHCVDCVLCIHRKMSKNEPNIVKYYENEKREKLTHNARLSVGDKQRV